jgi:hypothetical protein
MTTDQQTGQQAYSADNRRPADLNPKFSTSYSYIAHYLQNACYNYIIFSGKYSVLSRLLVLDAEAAEQIFIYNQWLDSVAEEAGEADSLLAR